MGLPCNFLIVSSRIGKFENLPSVCSFGTPSSLSSVVVAPSVLALIFLTFSFVGLLTVGCSAGFSFFVFTFFCFSTTPFFSCDSCYKKKKKMTGYCTHSLQYSGKSCTSPPTTTDMSYSYSDLINMCIRLVSIQKVVIL